MTFAQRQFVFAQRRQLHLTSEETEESQFGVELGGIWGIEAILTCVKAALYVSHPNRNPSPYSQPDQQPTANDTNKIFAASNNG